jgi:hypothetical protein
MKTETITRIKLTASDGMTLTNGEAFGKEIYLGSSDDADNWYEITNAEAEKLQEEKEVELNNG